MNIFMSSISIGDSVADLDDKRLLKQIIECKTILTIILENKKGGYANHPVTKYYWDKPHFVAYYGAKACKEYTYRFGKIHQYEPFFLEEMENLKGLCDNMPIYQINAIYVEGAANKPGSIRATEYTKTLFRHKLINKWATDKIPPKWTKRECPDWAKEKDNG